jgi:hypothetical protein
MLSIMRVLPNALLKIAAARKPHAGRIVHQLRDTTRSLTSRP